MADNIADEPSLIDLNVWDLTFCCFNIHFCYALKCVAVFIDKFDCAAAFEFEAVCRQFTDQFHQLLGLCFADIVAVNDLVRVQFGDEL
ncbi:hypothetical protein D9M69_568190 [compost metagenome]